MRLRRRSKREQKEGPWELWKSLPRVKPYLRPYRKYLISVLMLTFFTAVLGLAEPWPLAVILNTVVSEENPSGVVKFFFGDDPQAVQTGAQTVKDFCG